MPQREWRSRRTASALVVEAVTSVAAARCVCMVCGVPQSAAAYGSGIDSETCAVPMRIRARRVAVAVRSTSRARAICRSSVQMFICWRTAYREVVLQQQVAIMVRLVLVVLCRKMASIRRQRSEWLRSPGASQQQQQRVRRAIYSSRKIRAVHSEWVEGQQNSGPDPEPRQPAGSRRSENAVCAQ